MMQFSIYCVNQDIPGLIQNEFTQTASDNQRINVDINLNLTSQLISCFAEMI